MKALVLLVTWLAFVTAQDIPTDGDPCMASQYLTLDEPGRSIGIRPRSQEEVLDDSNLPEFWYRFTNPTGGTMPEACPPSVTCSSMNMAWMDATHPEDDGEIHSKKICINNNSDCKSSCFFVLVKNCGNFYVYKLKGLPRNAAYCSGSGTACPDGQTSPTGYTPCAAPEDIPVPPTSPQVGLKTEAKNFSMTCTFSSTSAEALHEVRWLAGGNQFLSKTVAAGERTATATEFELFFRGSTVVGNSVMCEVRAYKEGIPVGTAWISSPEPGYFLGIKVVDIQGNEVLEVEIDEDSKIPKLVFLKSTVPIRCNSEKWNADVNNPFIFWVTEEDCEINAHVVNKDFEDFARQLHGECPPESQETMKTIAGQLEFESCAVKMKPDNWEDHKLNSVTIRAVKDKVFDGRQSRYISFVVDVDYQGVWKGYEFPFLKVTALDTRQPNVGTSTCTSYNDPHLKTFDGTVYHNYNEGEYVLYQNLEFNFKVHAYYKTCNVKANFHASCNCGVAAQAGNDVIILDRCRALGDIIFTNDPNLQDKTYLRQRIIQRGDMTEGFTLEHVSGTKMYKIGFPHGAILTLTLTDSYEKQFVNLEMAPSQLDYSDDGVPKTQGLCGVFSRAQDDDMRLPDGTTYQAKDSDFGNIYKQFIPDQFNLAWRIDTGSGKSMYNGAISDDTDYDGHRFCACVKNQNTNNEEVLCAFGDDCRSIQDITGIVGTRTIARRKRRAAGEPSDNDYFMEGFDDSNWDFSFRPDSFLSTVKDLYEEVTVVEPAAPAPGGIGGEEGARGVGERRTAARRTVTKVLTVVNSPWPTESGKTEQFARTFCTNFVRNSEAVKACEFIPDVNFQDDIEMCISDIALSDTTDFAISAVQSIVTKCSEKVNSDMRLWTPNTDPRTNTTMKLAPPAVTSNMCPNDCSMNGVCSHGKCTCNAGFTGADCSGDATQPPSILVLAGGGRCDYKQRPCRATPVLGDNFIDGPSLKCRFQVAELTSSGPRATGELLETTPEFESYMEIHCGLPSADTTRGENTPPRAYMMSITNDGNAISNPKPLIVYDGSRYDCPSVQAACSAVTANK